MAGKDDPIRSEADDKREFNDVQRRALDLLSRREHTTRELRTKLSARGFQDTIIDRVLDHLVDKSFLSDSRFADMFVNARINKGYGALDIRARLSEKGVSTSISNEVLATHAIDWFEHALQVLRKKARGDRTFEPGTPEAHRVRAKYARFLQSRGFTTEQTMTALAQLNETEEDGYR